MTTLTFASTLPVQALGSAKDAPYSIFAQVNRQALLDSGLRLAMIAERSGLSLHVNRLALELHLQQQDAGPKRPLVLMLQRNGVDEAAVLLSEYMLLGMPARIYLPLDPDGELTVLSRPEDRDEVMRQAAAFLIHRQANLILFSWLQEKAASAVGTTGMAVSALSSGLTRGYRWQSRTVQRSLLLSGGYEASLAQLGAHTRRNVRASRRKLEREQGAAFHAEACISEADLFAMGQASSHPVSLELTRWRHERYGRVPGSFLAGVRSEEGQWLSLLGGRRFGTTTRVDWQQNRLQGGGVSMVAAMRGWLIDHEIGRGMTHLRFEQGTSHSMHAAFEIETIQDMLYVRPLLMRTGIAASLIGRLPEGNALKRILRDGATALADEH